MTKTEQYKKAYISFFIISIALNFLPLFIYIIMGYVDVNVEESKKVVLSFTLIAAIVLAVYNLLAKKHLRSVIWILLLGVYYAIQKIELLLLLMAICTIIDEFIVEPLVKHYKFKYKANKEIDGRMEDIKAYVTSDTSTEGE